MLQLCAQIADEVCAAREEVLLNRARLKELRRKLPQLCCIESAGQKLALLRLAFHDEVNGESRNVQILKRQQRLGMHIAAIIVVAEEHENVTRGLSFKFARDERQQRTECAAGGKRDVRCLATSPAKVCAFLRYRHGRRLDALEVVKRLKARCAQIMRFAGRRTKFADPAGF